MEDHYRLAKFLKNFVCNVVKFLSFPPLFFCNFWNKIELELELNLGELVELELKQRTLSHSVSFSFPASFMAALRPLCLSAFYHTSGI